MNTSNTRTKHFRSTVGKIVMALAFASVISTLSLVPAFGQGNGRRQGQQPPGQWRQGQQPPGQWRQGQQQRGWRGREWQDRRGWRGRQWQDRRRWRGRQWQGERRWRAYQPYGYSEPYGYSASFYVPPPVVYVPPPPSGINLFFPFR